LTKEFALLIPLGAIVVAVVLGVGFSTGFFHPEPVSSLNGAARKAEAIVATATPKDAPSLLVSAQNHMLLGEYAQAIVFLRAATRLTPKDIAAHKMLATAAFENNDMILAANVCHDTIKLDPTDTDALLGLARALYALNKFSDSAAACSAVLESPSSSLEQRQAARKILERITPGDQKRKPEVTYPIISVE
jgi:cytochrome c-type biogenesis protein CcmH/NrfG